MITKSLDSPQGDLPMISIPALVAYEDKPTRDHILRVFDRLASEFHEEFMFSFSWWRFDFLGDPLLAGQATDEAKAAELLVFGTRYGADLPPAVKHWNESWIHQRRTVGGALVAMTAFPNEARRALRPGEEYLREVARRADLEYLTAEDAFAQYHRIEQRYEMLPPELRDILVTFPVSSRHWGIND